MRRTILTICCAVGAFTGTAMAGEAYPPSAKDEGRAITRAEVLADLEMWNSAGLNKYPSAHGYPEITQTSEYQNSLREYRRLRNGPEYQAAVENLRSKVGGK